MLDYEPFKQLWKSNFQWGGGGGLGEGGGMKASPTALSALWSRSSGGKL